MDARRAWLDSVMAGGRPDAVAVEDDSELLTYAALAALSGRVEEQLLGHGAGPGAFVVHKWSGSVISVATILAILRCGAVWVPQEAAVDDSTPAGIAEELSSQGPVIVLEHHASGAMPSVVRRTEPAGGESSIDPRAAYVMFTSGTTGRPKGVIVGLESLAHFTRSAVSGYGIVPDDRVMQFSSASDGLVEQLFPTLAAGATMVLRDQRAVASPAAFREWCTARGITFLSLPTTLLESFLGRNTDALLADTVRTLLFGGDQLSTDAAAKLRSMACDRVRLINGYGPTEATVVATFFDLDEWDGSHPLPVGRPLGDVEVLIAGPDGTPLPDGDVGEVVIAGAGVALGYLGASEAEQDRFGTTRTARVFRTGDRGRIDGRGNLLLSGRMDRQVKLQGRRVELEGIEAALSEIPAVVAATVEYQPGATAGRLVATVELEPSRRMTASDLQRLLGARLPPHMVPSAFNLNGARAQGADPLDDAVSWIVETAAAVLGVPSLTPESDFFEAGGNSLSSLELVARTASHFDVELPPYVVFAARTPAALARAIRDEGVPRA